MSSLGPKIPALNTKGTAYSSAVVKRYNIMHVRICRHVKPS